MWKSMLNIKNKVEKVLWWEPKSGTSTIWFDNWTNTYPLFKQQFNYCFYWGEWMKI